MVTSIRTAEEILKVVERHVGRTALRRILTDLKDVEGNRSFKETLERMEQQLARYTQDFKQGGAK